MEKQENQSFDQQFTQGDDPIANFLGELGFGKHYKTVTGLTHLTARFLSHYTTSPLHFDMGSRAYSLMTTLFAVAFIELIGSITSLQNRMSMFLGSGINVEPFHLHGRVLLVSAVVHFIWIKYRDHILKREHYSYSMGRSLLFPLWKKLVDKIKLPILRTQFDFQQYVESTLVGIFGYFLYSNLGLVYGKFLLICAVSQLAFYQIMRNNFSKKILDIIDIRILNLELANAMEQKKQGGEKQSQPDRGFGLFNSHVMLNQMQNVMDSEQAIDPELAELQEKQSL